MAVFVVLALALAVVAVAVLVLAGLQLKRAVSRLGAAAVGVRDRLQPLTEELQREAAITTAEAEALNRSVERLRAAREQRKRGMQTVRQGLRRSLRGS